MTEEQKRALDSCRKAFEAEMGKPENEKWNCSRRGEGYQEVAVEITWQHFQKGYFAAITAQAVADYEVREAVDELEYGIAVYQFSNQARIHIKTLISAATTPKPCECDALVKVLEQLRDDEVGRLKSGVTTRRNPELIIIDITEALATHRKNKGEG